MTTPTIGSTSATVDLDFVNGVYTVNGSSVALSAALASSGSLTTDANGLICDGSTKFNLTGAALTNALGRGVLVVEVAAGTDNHYIFGEIGSDSFGNDVMVGVETTSSDLVFARVQNSSGETKSYDTVPFSTSTTYRAAMYLNGTAATFKAAWNGAHYWSPGLGLSSSPTDVYIGAGKNFGAFNLTGSVRRVFFVPQTADTAQAALEAISVVGATSTSATSYTLTAAVKAIPLTKRAANLTFSRALPAVKKTISITKRSTNLVYARIMPAAKKTITITKQAAILSHGWSMPAVKKSVPITKQVTNLIMARRLAASLKSVPITKRSANLVMGYRLIATPKSVPITKRAATLTYNTSKTMQAAFRTIPITKYPVGLILVPVGGISSGGNHSMKIAVQGKK